MALYFAEEGFYCADDRRKFVLGIPLALPISPVVVNLAPVAAAKAF